MRKNIEEILSSLEYMNKLAKRFEGKKDSDFPTSDMRLALSMVHEGESGLALLFEDD